MQVGETQNNPAQKVSPNCVFFLGNFFYGSRQISNFCKDFTVPELKKVWEQ